MQLRFYELTWVIFEFNLWLGDNTTHAHSAIYRCLFRYFVSLKLNYSPILKFTISRIPEQLWIRYLTLFFFRIMPTITACIFYQIRIPEVRRNLFGPVRKSIGPIFHQMNDTFLYGVLQFECKIWSSTSYTWAGLDGWTYMWLLDAKKMLKYKDAPGAKRKDKFNNGSIKIPNLVMAAMSAVYW